MRNAVDILHEEIEHLVGSLRAGIISYLGRRDELHVNSKSATLGERVLSRRLASRRLNHRLQDGYLVVGCWLGATIVLGCTCKTLIACGFDIAHLPSDILYE